MISTKEDASTSDKKLEVLYREYNIHHRDCLEPLIYLLTKIVDFCLEVHELAIFSSNTGKLNFEVLVHLLRYIRYNKKLRIKILFQNRGCTSI